MFSRAINGSDFPLDQGDEVLGEVDDVLVGIHGARV